MNWVQCTELALSGVYLILALWLWRYTRRPKHIHEYVLKDGYFPTFDGKEAVIGTVKLVCKHCHHAKLEPAKLYSSGIVFYFS